MKSKMILAAILIAPTLALAQPWTAAGPTAVVDPTATGLYTVAPQYIGFALGAGAGNIITRFNVTDTTASGLPGWNTLEMSYFDNSPNSQLTASLIRLDKCNGSLNTMCTVTSTDSSSTTCIRCTFATPIDFNLYTYYVRVTINRTDTVSTPRLFTVRVF